MFHCLKFLSSPSIRQWLFGGNLPLDKSCMQDQFVHECVGIQSEIPLKSTLSSFPRSHLARSYSPPTIRSDIFLDVTTKKRVMVPCLLKQGKYALGYVYGDILAPLNEFNKPTVARFAVDLTSTEDLRFVQADILPGKKILLYIHILRRQGGYSEYWLLDEMDTFRETSFGTILMKFKINETKIKNIGSSTESRVVTNQYSGTKFISKHSNSWSSWIEKFYEYHQGHYESYASLSVFSALTNEIIGESNFDYSHIDRCDESLTTNILKSLNIPDRQGLRDMTLSITPQDSQTALAPSRFGQKASSLGKSIKPCSTEVVLLGISSEEMSEKLSSRTYSGGNLLDYERRAIRTRFKSSRNKGIADLVCTIQEEN